MFYQSEIIYHSKHGLGKHISHDRYSFFDGERELKQGEFEHIYRQNIDTKYATMILDILHFGNDRKDRTGVGTQSVFGYQQRFNLLAEFPILSLKKTHFKSIVGELLWFLSGCKGGIKGLNNDYGVTIWNEWDNGKKIAYENMVSWKPPYKELPFVTQPLNQLAAIIEEIKNNPDSRRLLVSNWNAWEVHDKQNALDPCHVLFQFYVHNGQLSCHLYQRSADVFLGVPFNIASYALLTKMIAKECNLVCGDFIHSFGDLHLYKNHFDAAKELLMRKPKYMPNVSVELVGDDGKSIFDYKPEDIKLLNYNPYPAIKADVAV